MTKKKSNKKKVVIGKKKDGTIGGGRVVSPTVSRGRAASASAKKEPLLFTKETYIWMGVGALLVALGMIAMSGGSMPDANTWDPDIIYGFRRTVLAPFLILAGLAVEIYAIFKKPPLL